MDAAEARANLEAEAEMLVQDSLDRLEMIYWENGGEAWLFEEPRFHMWKGIDELFSATHYAHEGDINAMNKHMQHGLNHIWMASFIAHGGGEPDPLLSDQPGATIQREVLNQVNKTCEFTAVIDAELDEGRMHDFDISITEGDSEVPEFAEVPEGSCPFCGGGHVGNYCPKKEDNESGDSDGN